LGKERNHSPQHTRYRINNSAIKNTLELLLLKKISQMFPSEGPEAHPFAICTNSFALPCLRLLRTEP